MSKVDMVMPQMGESIAEGTIIKWHKKEGEQVERDEVILEISTDKVDSEIPSPESGTVQKILFPEGETVKVGEVIAHIDTEGDGKTAGAEEKAEPEQKAEKQEEKAQAQEKKPEEKEEKKKKEAEIEAKEEKSEPEEKLEEKVPGKEAERPRVSEVGAAGYPRTDRSRRKFYSPLVRSIARAEGIEPEEIEEIDGSGANGRVTKQDLLQYIKSRDVGAPSKAAPTPSALEPEYSDERTEIIPMDNMRKSIAQHMVKSVQTSPHVFAVSEADMTNLVNYRKEHKEQFQQKTGVKLTYMPFIIQACARALLDFPMVNSSVDGDKIIRKKYINIGMAVALENNGLIVPVVKGADGMSIVGLARAANDLAQRARSKKLTPGEVQDGTFSITNMGVFGSLMGLPVINQPQVAILGVGTIKKRPVVINDAIAIRDMMYISLSFDHRIVDGALAGQFLERIAEYLTNFDTKNIL